MSMSKLEIARGTRTTLTNVYTALAEALEESGGAAVMFTKDERALHKKWWSFWCERVAELEAAEKEQLPPVTLNPSHGILSDRTTKPIEELDKALYFANAKIERLEGRFDQHNHHHEMIADEAKCVTFALSGPKQIEEVKP